MNRRLRGALDFIRSVANPRAWTHLLRLAHYWNYAHVRPLGAAELGPGTSISPTATFRNGERITIGEGSLINVGVSLWAGNATGRITLGAHVLLGPNVYVTASNYELAPGIPVMYQGTVEQDVWIGDGAWLGYGVVVLPGVAIGAGCVVGAGAVVTSSLPANSIAVGVPARVVGMR